MQAAAWRCTYMYYIAGLDYTIAHISPY